MIFNIEHNIEFVEFDDNDEIRKSAVINWLTLGNDAQHIIIMIIGLA